MAGTQQERDDYLQGLDAIEDKPNPGFCWVYRTWCPLPEHQPVSENLAGRDKCGRREMKRRAHSLQEAHSLIFTHLRESPYHDWQVDADEAWELAADCVDPGERAGRPYLDKQQVLAKQEVVIPEEPYEWQAPKRPKTQPATTSGGGGPSILQTVLQGQKEILKAMEEQQKTLNQQTQAQAAQTPQHAQHKPVQLGTAASGGSSGSSSVRAGVPTPEQLLAKQERLNSIIRTGVRRLKKMEDLAQNLSAALGDHGGKQINRY